MVTEYITETGSVYVIDDQNFTWQRTTRTDMSGLLRSDGDPLWSASCAGLGFPLIIDGPPLAIDAMFRRITTSRVIAVRTVTGKDEL